MVQGITCLRASISSQLDYEPRCRLQVLDKQLFAKKRDA